MCPHCDLLVSILPLPGTLAVLRLFESKKIATEAAPSGPNVHSGQLASVPLGPASHQRLHSVQQFETDTDAPEQQLLTASDLSPPLQRSTPHGPCSTCPG